MAPAHTALTSARTAVTTASDAPPPSGVRPRDARYYINDERDIDAVLRDAAMANAAATWSSPEGGSGAGTLTTDDGKSVHFQATGDEKLPAQVLLAFTLYGVPLRAECRVEQGRLVGLERLSISESRSATRVVPKEPVRLEWYSTTDEGVRIDGAPLLDFGRDGGRTLHAFGEPLPENGPFAATIVADGTTLHCMAEVRSSTITARGVELGLRFVAEDPKILADLVLKSLFPEIRLRREVPVEELTHLFRASGYHRLRDGAVPSEEWSRMDADEITRDIVYVGKDGAAVAHGSVTRVYRNTWLGHQMAVRQDHPEAARARGIQTAMIMISSLIGGQEARSMAYYDAEKGYGRVFFDRFVESVGSPDLATAADFDWIDRDALPLILDTELPAHLSVSLAKESELGAVADLVRRQLPRLQADAMDIRPASLRSDALHPAYRGSGLSRGREVFVVRARGRIVGAALCEHTSRHLNLLNELNMAQFFFVRGAAEPRAQRALQQAVRCFYAERGIMDPFVVAPTDTFDLALDPHARVHMRIRCITWSFDGLRAYENYLRLRCAWHERDRKPNLRPRVERAANG